MLCFPAAKTMQDIWRINEMDLPLSLLMLNTRTTIIKNRIKRMMHYLDLLYYLALHKILIFLKSYPASKKGPAANLTKYFF